MKTRTPGPWSIGSGLHSSKNVYANDRLIAPCEGDEEVLNDPQNQANARLVAQAPSLLENLKQALQMLSRIADGETYDAMEYMTFMRQMRDVIAQAEGE